MACTPPLCNGTGGWCGCNCECCPPDPCYSSVDFIFECGSADDLFPADGYPFSDGCDCIAVTFAYSVNARKPQPMPTFSQDEIKIQTDDGFVFALADCSIPCQTPVTVSVTTDGCCFQVSGTGVGSSVTVVGAGNLTASGGPSGDCAGTVNINGSPSPVAAADCDGVSVSISPSDACCTCCLIDIQAGAPAFALRANSSILQDNILIRQMKKGQKQMKISRNALLNAARKRAEKLALRQRRNPKRAD